MSEQLKEDPRIQNWVKAGRPFQWMICVALMYQSAAHGLRGTWESPPPILLIGWVGMATFTYCLYILYVLKKRVKGLITTGLYRYTRHPMYNAALLIAVDVWWPMSTDDPYSYWISLVCYLTGLLIAGYCQEQEVLERFGDEARAYYAKTPRVFLLYPFVR